MVQGKKGSGAAKEGECSECHRIMRLAVVIVSTCHNCYQKYRLSQMSPEKLAEYKERHRENCLAYYWRHRDEQRARQRELYQRTPKRIRKTKKARVERVPPTVVDQSGPCPLCGDRYSDHGLCRLVLVAREGLND